MILFFNGNVKLFIQEKKSLVTEVKKIEKSIKYITQIENNKAFATRVTRRVALVEQELLTVLEAHEFTPKFVGFVLLNPFFCVVYLYNIIVCPFGNFIVCPSVFCDSVIVSGFRMVGYVILVWLIGK